MPTLRNHTHCQVAQKSQRINQNLPKSMAAPAHWQTAKIKPRKPNNLSYVMRASAVFQATARCCNTANSSLTIDGKHEILITRIGSVRA